MLDVITIGSATRDTFFVTDKGRVFKDPANPVNNLIGFEFGTKVSIEDLHINDGGGACNSGTAFLRLGFGTKAIMRVGDDELGKVVIEEFEAEGGDSGAITVDPKMRTGISAIIIDKNSGERTVLFYPGANLNLEFGDLSVLDDAKWLYAAPLSAEKPAANLTKVCKYAKNAGIQISFNPSQNHLEKGYKQLKTILECTSVLLVNLQEAEMLVSSYLGRPAGKDPGELLKNICAMGPRIGVITLSGQGSIASVNGKIYRQAPAPSNPVDTTGAGDSFGSTFVAALMMGYDVEASLGLAAMNSAAVISQYGAQKGLLTLTELRKRYAKVS